MFFCIYCKSVRYQIHDDIYFTIFAKPFYPDPIFNLVKAFLVASFIRYRPETNETIPDYVLFDGAADPLRQAE